MADEKHNKDEDDEIARLLKSVVDSFDKEDSATRERQIRRYRRLKLYWNNFSQIYWAETARDYRIAALQDVTSANTDQAYYDRPINVFRAFLETIIAAISIQIPAVTCIPDDPENSLDISTANAGNKISEMLYKQNNVIFLWLQALYIYCTEGMIACYTYAEEDEKYGTYEVREEKDEEVEMLVCPNCQMNLPDDILARNIEDEFDPGDEDAALEDIIKTEGPVCPECATLLDPNLQKSKLIIPRFVGITNKPKTRICMEVYGGLYVRVPNYAKQQKDIPYLSFGYETHYANALEWFPRLRKKFSTGPSSAAAIAGSNNEFEQTARLNPQYFGDVPDGTVTVNNWWLRPAAFNVLTEDDCNKLKAEYPEGVKVTLVNEICADYCAENLDDHWTLTKNPTSDFLTFEPLGELLTNIQDIINDLISLTLQTIEHGVTQVWADPSVVNFPGQAQVEIAPGVMSPTKPQGANKNISDAFFSTQAASLSPETLQLFRIVQELGQFVSAAMPSLFGGAQIGKTSQTATEYTTSRSMALQRLQTPWRMMTIWWKEIFGKVIPAQMKEINSDERYVEKNDQGNFVNVFIRKAEISGKIGSVELESSDQIPISDEQKRDILLQLMQLNNMEVFQALVSPENLPFVKKVTRMTEFKLPGEDDRQKQLEEIQILISTGPLTIPDLASGQEVKLPSVEPDPIVDNHIVEAAICRSWLVGEAGRLCKLENRQGYENVLLHMQMHIQLMQQAAMEQQAMQPPAEGEQQTEKSNTEVKADVTIN